MTKIHIEVGANNPVRAFGAVRRGVRKVFAKEMLLEQDFKGWIGVFCANQGNRRRGRHNNTTGQKLQEVFGELQAMCFEARLGIAVWHCHQI